MDHEIAILCGTAAAIGLIHTVIGPDHYLPFIVMSRAGHWSRMKTGVVTLLCGLGHVLSSVVLGLIGIAIILITTDKQAVESALEAVESTRGTVAAWLLIGFGFAYFIWGIHRAIRNKVHTHTHAHDSKDPHVHEHSHEHEHTHIHEKAGKGHVTPWIMFTIFVFGPCEPLIPVLMFPAATRSVPGMILVTAVFALVTVVTMFALVLLGTWGLNFTRLGKFERYAHALAGGAICASGLAIQFLGL